MTNIVSKAEILEIIFRHKLKIVLVPLVVMVLTIATILFFPRKYRSEAKLFLQVGRESLGMDATATMGPSAGLVQNNRDEEVKSALQVVSGRGVIALVVEKLGEEYVLTGAEPGEQRPPSSPMAEMIKSRIGSVLGVLSSLDPVSQREKAIIEIEKSLKVEAERNSMVISAKLDSDSPKVAQRILDTLIEAYQDEHLRIHRNRRSGNFLSDQRDLLQQQYTEAQEKVKNLKNEYGLSSIEGRRSSLEMRLHAIELEKIQNLQELTANRAKSSNVKTQLVSIPERETSSQKSIPNEGADQLNKELFTNQIRFMDQKSRYTSNHPLYLATSKQIEDAKEVVDKLENRRQESVDDINPIHRALTLELRQQEAIIAGLEARREELICQHEEVSSALKLFNRQAIELTQLEQEEQVARDKYLQYTNSLEQARIDKALEDGKISSVSVAQKATLAEKPVSPSKVLVLVGGLFMAVSGVVSLVFLSEKMNDRIRSEDDLSRVLGLPVLVTLTESAINKKILAR